MEVNRYRGFEGFGEQTAYTGWKVYYEGYDYSGTLLRRSLSQYLYNNPKVAGFLDILNRFMVGMVEDVKYIRNFFNYAVPRGYRKIN